VAGIQCRFQVVLWLAAANVFRRKKPGKVLPDDFRRRVAEEPLRSWVPAADVSISCNQKDRIFQCVGHEQVKSLAHFLRRKLEITG